MKNSVEIDHDAIAHVGFVGAEGSRVFRAITAPRQGGSRLRLVICPPVGAEAARNYRREVLLGRRLAAAGIESVRFHYRGTGQSDPLSEVGLASMLADAEEVARAADDGVPTVWMGTRVGGSVAAVMAEQTAAHALIVWDPVLDAVAYFREILRARVFSAFRSDEAGTAPKVDLIGDLRSTGWTDLLGYRIGAGLLDELCGASPLKNLQMADRSVLLVDIRRKGDVRAETQRLAQAWQAAGARVSAVGVALYEPWWYGARSGSSTDDDSDPNQALLDATLGFLASAGSSPT